MQSVAGKENRTLDVFKLAASMIIAATHLPSFFASEITAFYYHEWFFRFCVPLFFISTGYFFFKTGSREKSIKRIAFLYAVSYVLYLPLILETASDGRSILSVLRWNLVIGYEHLWYLNAALGGLLLWYLLDKLPVTRRLLQKIGIPVAVLLILLGALLDEYYRIVDCPATRFLGEFLARFGGPRNMIFMGFPLLVLGGGLARYETQLRRIPTGWILFLMLLFYGLSFVECQFLQSRLGNTITNDITFFNCWPALFLFELSFRIPLNIPDPMAKKLRKMAEYIYILHPLAAMGIGKVVTLPPLFLWIATILLCMLICLLLERRTVRVKT